METQTRSAPDGENVSVLLNGEAASVPQGTTVTTLLENLGFMGGKVAVERNRAIVARSQFAETCLAEGDEIEIVRFVGGG